ncbi:MAG: terpene cyclase/mutase family protein [Planctomycetaceae bacterium]|nr:terpene cyclase/mutase family protein [Planctomycetaceae bacterium]
MYSHSWIVLLFGVALVITPPAAHAADEDSETTKENPGFSLSEQQWQTIDESVDRALKFLITQQDQDGSFPTFQTGQPGVTSLCVLAYLSRGHVPGEGPYGDAITRAINFVLSKQRDDGLLFDIPIGQFYSDGSPAKTGIYNHAIAGLMLAEIYGMGTSKHDERIRVAVDKGIDFTLKHQSRYRRNPEEQGGWRYLRLRPDHRSDADLSITSWQLLFLRSAKNAEFDVPQLPIDNAMAYVERCYDPQAGTFVYCIVSGRHTTPAMAGAGIISLSMGGRHNSEPAIRAGEWMARQRFDQYRGVERYHYSAYYCSQAAYQLGGDYWSRFYPPLMKTLVDNQRPDGSWTVGNEDARYGNAYSTALGVLALTPPYQILPIYQR